MGSRSRSNAAFRFSLVVAMLLHALLFLIPSVRQAATRSESPDYLTVRLVRPNPEPARERIPPVQQEPELAAKVGPDGFSPSVSERHPVEEDSAQPEPSPEAPPASILLSRQFDYTPSPDPLADFLRQKPKSAEFHYRERTSLEEALNKPSLQLPFRDTRIYLVDSYDPGLKGGIDRFFDKVTVPFGFTTDFGTRVQCAWILVIAGCSWGPAELFYRGQKARHRKTE